MTSDIRNRTHEKKTRAHAKTTGKNSLVGAKATKLPSASKKSHRVIVLKAADLFPKGKSLTAFRYKLRDAKLHERIQLERDGVPYYVVTALGESLGTSVRDFQSLFRIPPATYKKKVATKDFFSGATGQSVVETMDLINKVEELLDPENPEVKDFDAAKWVGNWIRKPQPSLGGRQPDEIMDTPTGREQVLRLLGAIASGAYL